MQEKERLKALPIRGIPFTFLNKKRATGRDGDQS